jgi:hypothetical protein
MEQHEEFDFALNEASIYFEGGNLVVAYEEDTKTLKVSMSDQQIALTKQVLAQGDFWTAWLGAVSNAVDKVQAENGYQ